MSQCSAAVIVRIGRSEVESRPWVADGYGDIRSTRRNGALNSLLRVVAAAVKHRISQSLLQSDEYVDLIACVAAVLADKLHDFFTGLRQRCQIAGERELPDRELRLAGYPVTRRRNVGGPYLCGRGRRRLQILVVYFRRKSHSCIMRMLDAGCYQ